MLDPRPHVRYLNAFCNGTRALCEIICLWCLAPGVPGYAWHSAKEETKPNGSCQGGYLNKSESEECYDAAICNESQSGVPSQFRRPTADPTDDPTAYLLVSPSIKAPWRPDSGSPSSWKLRLILFLSLFTSALYHRGTGQPPPRETKANPPWKVVTTSIDFLDFSVWGAAGRLLTQPPTPGTKFAVV